MTEQRENRGNLIFEDYGITLLKRGDKFFIRYDAGELVAQFEEVEVSELQAIKAQQGERQAYEVLLEVQRKQERAN